MGVSWDQCRLIFAGTQFSDKLAEQIEAIAPDRQCELFSVGDGTPGPVGDETLLRIIVSPADYDPISDTVLRKPFEKCAATGVSVVRGLAADGELVELCQERLGAAAGKGLHLVLSGSSAAIRGHEEAFGIYDQTVPRFDPALSPFPSHAGVFLRKPPPKTDGRKQRQKDYANWLFEQFEANRHSLDTFRNGLLAPMASPTTE